MPAEGRRPRRRGRPAFPGVRVLLAVPSATDPAHAAVLRGLAPALRRAGHQVRTSADGFRSLGAWKADVVHAHVFSRRARITAPESLLVMTHQGASVELLDDPAGFKRAAARADVLTAVCESGRRELRRLTGRSDVAVVHNGAEVWVRRGKEKGVPTVLTVGRLAAYKGLDILAMALAELAGKGVRFRWVACGPDQTRGRLPRFVRRLGLPARFPGTVPPAAVRRLLLQAAVFVQPSRAEGSPMAVAEALAAGCPLVASAVGGVPELVGRAGLLVAPGDPEALARALSRVLGDRGVSERLRGCSRRRSENLTWDDAARAYIRLYARHRLTKSP